MILSSMGRRVLNDSPDILFIFLLAEFHIVYKKKWIVPSHLNGHRKTESEVA